MRSWGWGGGMYYCYRARPPKPVWRPQKVGLVWSVPVSSKDNDRTWTNGGGSVSYVGGGGVPKQFFGEGFMVFFLLP